MIGRFGYGFSGELLSYIYPSLLSQGFSFLSKTISSTSIHSTQRLCTHLTFSFSLRKCFHFRNGFQFRCFFFVATSFLSWFWLVVRLWWWMMNNLFHWKNLVTFWLFSGNLFICLTWVKNSFSSSGYYRGISYWWLGSFAFGDNGQTFLSKYVR